MQIILRVRIQFGKSLGQLAQRQQRDARYFGDFIFIHFAHVHHLDAEGWIIQGLLHVLHGNFVGVAHVFRFRHNATESFVIN